MTFLRFVRPVAMRAALLSAGSLFSVPPALAQEAPPAQEVPEPAPAAPLPAPAPDVEQVPAPRPDQQVVVPVPAAPPTPPPPVLTDHQLVVGRWGADFRHLGTFQRTPGQERGCEEECPLALNSVGLRRWSMERFAWHAGLAIGVGGGAGRRDGDVRRWDTFIGFGPTLGTSFLLANWRHLAVSAGPQLDAVVFMPSRRGSKSFLFNLRGVLEGEFHLGVLGYPEASFSLSGGIQASLLYATEHQRMPVDRDTALKWSITASGPQSFWDMVTKVQLRYYF
jgi:hypothetical protein